MTVLDRLIWRKRPVIHGQHRTDWHPAGRLYAEPVMTALPIVPEKIVYGKVGILKGTANRSAAGPFAGSA
ncbi:MAG: hypothetical protein WDZ63_01130, partial [Burkholderiales bacterium]